MHANILACLEYVSSQLYMQDIKFCSVLWNLQMSLWPYVFSDYEVITVNLETFWGIVDPATRFSNYFDRKIVHF